MSIRMLDPNFAVTGQVQPADLTAIAANGFRAVVCMRPDGEGFPQPSFAEMEAAAQSAGVSIHYLPVKPGVFSDTQATQLKSIMTATQGPILAYCASGNRCSMAYEWAKRA